MTIKKKESAATKRAANYNKGPEWFCEFRYSPANGLGYEEGVNRRDPSSVLKIGDSFYVWYTKSIGPHVGFGTGDLEAKVWPLLATGKIKPIIRTTFPLAEAAEAHRLMESSAHIGKIMLVTDHASA